MSFIDDCRIVYRFIFWFRWISPCHPAFGAGGAFTGVFLGVPDNTGGGAFTGVFRGVPDNTGGGAFTGVFRGVPDDIAVASSSAIA